MKRSGLSMCLLLIAAAVMAGSVRAQTTEFTYQGSLQNSSAPANGNFDFEFLLFDAASGGTQFGSTLTRSSVAVTAGTFAVKLDFGNWFTGTNRFLEIHVRTAGSGSFTPLTPRQAVSTTPYANKSLIADSAMVAISATNATNATNAATATNALQLGGVAANQYVLTGDARLSDARPPTAGSSNYIQNGTSAQASSNFNISGTGTANVLNAATQFNIGGNRVLSVAGGSFAQNLFAGLGTGNANTTGFYNAFFGHSAGVLNTTGSYNAFFGRNAGLGNTTGDNNAFFGQSAGSTNSTGDSNAFFGKDGGVSNTTGSFNSFFGRTSGNSNTTGGNNAFFGIDAGYGNTTGSGNSFFGQASGVSNTTGISNTIIGANANVGSGNLTNATAIGANSFVTQSNSLVLGNSANVGIGTSAPNFKLHIVGGNMRLESLQFPSFSLNFAAGTVDAKKWQNYAEPNNLVFSALNDAETFDTVWLRVKRGSGTAISSVVLPNGNVGVGTAAPNAKLEVAGGSVYIQQPNSLIITSPNGACWFITVNNAGALATISVPCP